MVAEKTAWKTPRWYLSGQNKLLKKAMQPKRSAPTDGVRLFAASNHQARSFLRRTIGLSLHPTPCRCWTEGGRKHTNSAAR